MFTLDLYNLKIEKIKEKDMQHIYIQLPNQVMSEIISLSGIKSLVDSALENHKEDINDVAAQAFHFYVDSDSSTAIATNSECLLFYTLKNVILTCMQNFLLVSPKTPRSREKRLDVPEGLKDTNCSMSFLKNLINFTTITTCFTLDVKYKDLIFQLIDSKGQY